MPKTPSTKRRLEGQYNSRSYPGPAESKIVTFAVTLNAVDTPDAKRKFGQSMQYRHLHTIRSPISGSNRVFLGNSDPLNDIRIGAMILSMKR